MITINYGKDIIKTTFDTLVASDIKTYLKQGMKAAIKPNLVKPDVTSNGATTHPEVIEGIIQFLKEYGIQNISVIENSAVGYCTKQAYKVCGYETLNKKYNVPLIDLKDDKFVTLNHDGTDIKIFQKALETDFLINVPVLKGHSQTRLTCCMKNLKGCIPHDEMKRFHTLGLHKPIAALNVLLKTGYCVVDSICGDLSFEEGGTPVEANRIIAGQNPFLVDSYCAQLIGYKPQEIEYFSFGKKYGLGDLYSQDTKIVELNSDCKPLASVKSNRTADKYRSLIEEDSACSVCFAALVYAMHRGSETVFLRNFPKCKKVCIGQGFRGKSSDCLGIGNCASGFKEYVKGCPPKAADILESLS